MTGQRTQRRVVCAALKKGAVVVCGPRHFDYTMHEQIARVGINASTSDQSSIVVAISSFSSKRSQMGSGSML